MTNLLQETIEAIKEACNYDFDGDELNFIEEDRAYLEKSLEQSK